jgi:hypothetical protein
MKRRNPVGASQNRAIIGCPAMLGYGAKLNAAETEEGLLSPLVFALFYDLILDNFYYIGSAEGHEYSDL